MLRWARAPSPDDVHGHRGDIAVWGNGSHVGIYLGNGRAISTLTRASACTGLRALTTRFTTFIRTGLSGPTLAGRRGEGEAGRRPRRRSSPTAPSPCPRSTCGAHRACRPAVSRVLDRGTHVGVIRSAKDSRGRTWYRVVVGSRVGWVAGWLRAPRADSRRATGPGPRVIATPSPPGGGVGVSRRMRHPAWSRGGRSPAPRPCGQATTAKGRGAPERFAVTGMTGWRRDASAVRPPCRAPRSAAGGARSRRRSRRRGPSRPRRGSGRAASR